MGCARRAAQWPQGRRQAHRVELEFHRYRGKLRSQSGEFRADLCGWRAGDRCRCQPHAGARRAGRVIARLTTFPEAIGAGKIKVSGDPMQLGELMMLMDEFPRMFE